MKKERTSKAEGAEQGEVLCLNTDLAPTAEKRRDKDEPKPLRAEEKARQGVGTVMERST